MADRYRSIFEDIFLDPNPCSSVESNPPTEVRGPAPSESVIWFSGAGFVILFMAQAVGLVTNRIGGSVLQVSIAMAILAAAYSFLATLLYLVVTLLLPRGATIATRIIAAIAFFGVMAMSSFIVERIGQPNLPGIVTLPVSIVMLVATEFLFLRYRYRKV